MEKKKREIKYKDNSRNKEYSKEEKKIRKKDCSMLSTETTGESYTC